MTPDEIVLHCSRASWSITAPWMLEELGAPYRLVDRDLRGRGDGTRNDPKLNPMGRAPTLQIGRVVVSEIPAICIYLADRYGYGSLAPCIEDPDRGAYLKWIVFSTAWLEPATAPLGPAGQPSGRTDPDEALQVLAEALSGRDYILGPRFSAADVMLGSCLAEGLFTGALSSEPALVAYAERLQARRAWERAADLTWPEALYA